ncbi:hypothetical protein, partial [Streptomyces sp. NPDC050121]|uniref:hypothetical protein n=1 Tax=Streptomyces sp. NPDC050121 TaxID=3365601 RepID=UPI0037B85AAB
RVVLHRHRRSSRFLRIKQIQYQRVHHSGGGSLHLYIGTLPVDDGNGQATFTAAQQGSGELAVGRGTTAGTTGHYLPGALQKLRVWTGAMSWAQVLNQIPDSGV